MLNGFDPSLLTAARYCVVDLEATCSDDGAVPRNEMEIIEIGAVMWNRETRSAVGEFQSFLRPVRNPLLTDFCCRLTSISQGDVDRAEGFTTVVARFREWLSQGRDDHRPDREVPVFASWGDFDRGQFERDCQFHAVEWPFGGAHLNVKKLFSVELGTRRPYGLGQAIQRVGLTFSGTPHRGIDDARNIARVMETMLSFRGC